MTASSARRLPGGLFLFLLLIFCVPAAARAAELTVSVAGVRASTGTMRIALFIDPDSFPSGEEAYAVDVAALAGVMEIRFPDLPPATYALALHHDENANGEMDTNFLGIPLEGYGFSNDARVFLGPPSFRAASFELPVGGREITVSVRY